MSFGCEIQPDTPRLAGGRLRLHPHLNSQANRRRRKTQYIPGTRYPPHTAVYDFIKIPTRSGDLNLRLRDSINDLIVIPKVQ